MRSSGDARTKVLQGLPPISRAKPWYSMIPRTQTTATHHFSTKFKGKAEEKGVTRPLKKSLKNGFAMGSELQAELTEARASSFDATFEAALRATLPNVKERADVWQRAAGLGELGCLHHARAMAVSCWFLKRGNGRHRDVPAPA